MEGSITYVDRHGVDREVATGQVLDQVLRKGDDRFPRVVKVGLRTMGRDLQGVSPDAGTHCAEPLTLEPHGVGRASYKVTDPVRGSVGRQVEVGGGSFPDHQRVAYRPPDQVQAVASLSE